MGGAHPAVPARYGQLVTATPSSASVAPRRVLVVDNYDSFVFNLVQSYFKGRLAGNDPWDAWTLEWATSSPPPAYNFAVIPEVKSRRPLWDMKHPEDPDSRYE